MGTSLPTPSPSVTARSKVSLPQATRPHNGLKVSRATGEEALPHS